MFESDDELTGMDALDDAHGAPEGDGDINSVEFFSDDNLEALGEDSLRPVLPTDEVEDGGEADDPDTEDSDSDDGGDGDDDDSADDDGDSDDADVDEDDEPDDDSDDQFGPGTKSYDEIRAYANRTKAELDRLKAEFEELKSAPTREVPPATPAFDEGAFSQVVAQNPIQAFDYALQGGNDRAAAMAIARVQADANELAAQAQVAYQRSLETEDQSDAENAAAKAQLARQAAEAAEDMRVKHQVALSERSLRPLQERQFNDALNLAGQHIESKFPDAREYADAIATEIRNDPRLLGDGTPTQIAQGMERAYKRAKAEALEANPVDMEEMIAQKVAEGVEKAMKKQRKARMADTGASGEASGRRAPSADDTRSPDEIEAAKARKSMFGDAGSDGPIGVSGLFKL